ncbi:MAG TPA: DNA polymerase III subunit beta [Clostridiaceae bacterium]|jgi:DNA polymerase-3 subunit beta|nr:DNA polymerase III subunit beta [Clostridiaceae bacterium]
MTDNMGNEKWENLGSNNAATSQHNAISCDRELLANGVGTVQRAVSSRSTLPILQGVLIETTNQGLHLIGTDLELSIETYVPVTSVGDFHMVLPAKYFSEIVRRLPEREVVIEWDSEKKVATILSGKAVYEINSMDPGEYPLFPEVPNTPWWKVPGTELANFVRKTVFCAAVEETRPFLTGVFMEFKENEVNFVATDSFRLAVTRVSNSNSAHAERDRGLLVPARTLSEVARIVQGSETEVEVYASENQVAFKCRETTIVSRLIEGQFPSYDRVIPQQHSTLIVVERGAFQESVDRVSIMGKDEFGTIRLSARDNVLTVSANAPEVGKALDQVSTVRVEGENGEIALKARYLMDVLKAVEDEEICLKLTGTASPVIITQADVESKASGGFLYLIMPVTLNA